MSISNQEQEYNSSDVQFDTTVRSLARRLAPDVDAQSESIMPELRKSRASPLLFSLLFIIALMPSIVLAVVAVGNPEVEHLLQRESRRAVAMLSALPTMLGDKGSLRPKNQTKPKPVAVDITREIKARPNEEIPLKVTLSPLDSLSADSRLLVRGFPKGAVLSSGRPHEAGWILRPEELHDLQMMLPAESTGHHALVVELIAPDGTTIARATTQLNVANDSREGSAPAPGEVKPAQTGGQVEVMKTPEEIVALAPEEIEPHQTGTQLVAKGSEEEPVLSAETADPGQTGTQLGMGPEEKLVLRPEEIERAQDLIAHGRKMIDVGYFAGARAYFRRAAEAGSGEAALALGATYDPYFIDEMGVRGIKPEPAEARIWYERAKELGGEGAEAKLAALDRPQGAEDLPTPQSASQIEARPAAPSTRDSSTSSVAVTAGSRAHTMVIASPNVTSAIDPQGWAEPYGAANMRKAPSPHGEVMRIIRKGTKLRVLANKESWLQVTDPQTGEIGWIYSKAVAITEALAPRTH